MEGSQVGEIIFRVVEVRGSLVREGLCCVNKTCLNFILHFSFLLLQRSPRKVRNLQSQIPVVLNANLQALSDSPNKSLHVLGVFQTV